MEISECLVGKKKTRSGDYSNVPTSPPSCGYAVEGVTKQDQRKKKKTKKGLRRSLGLVSGPQLHKNEYQLYNKMK